MNNTNETQETMPIKACHPSGIPFNHPFPMWNGIRTPESTALLNGRFTKTLNNPMDVEDALL